MQLTHLSCKIRWFSVNADMCNHHNQYYNIFISPKETFTICIFTSFSFLFYSALHLFFLTFLLFSSFPDHPLPACFSFFSLHMANTTLGLAIVHCQVGKRGRKREDVRTERREWKEERGAISPKVWEHRKLQNENVASFQHFPLLLLLTIIPSHHSTVVLYYKLTYCKNIAFIIPVGFFYSPKW